MSFFSLSDKKRAKTSKFLGKSIFLNSFRYGILEYVNDVSNLIERKKFYLDLFSPFNKTHLVQFAWFLYEPELVRDSFIVCGPLGPGPPSSSEKRRGLSQNGRLYKGVAPKLIFVFFSIRFFGAYSLVAQRLEQMAVNYWVVGSNPT